MKKILALCLLATLAFSSCAHKKEKQKLTLSNLRGKSVALVNIDAPKEVALHVETAVVNEVIEHGRFQIVDRKSVQEAMVHHPAESDWGRLGKELKADLLLAIDVLEFKTDKRSGYDAVEEEDSLLSSEQRESYSKKWKKYSKVHQRDGTLKLRFKFYDVASKTYLKISETETTGSYNSRDGDMPRAIKLLETLTAKAFAQFFEDLKD